ncbi:Rrp15p-domain-containing protein, partial [Dimargaris cristalligena]
SADFASAINHILGTKLTTHDRKAPIMVRNRGVERKLNEHKLEDAARRVLSLERRKMASRDRVVADFSNAEYEKSLRKVATRGVVRLFNAIKNQQRGVEAE